MLRWPGIAAATCFLLLLATGPRGLAAAPVTDADLVAKAQAQGSVSIYIAMTAEDIQKLVNRFNADYPGVKLQALRLESDQIPAKLTIEQRSGHYDVDAEVSPGLQTDQMKRAGYLVSMRIPEDRDYRPGYVDPDGFWRVGFMNTDAIAYNVNKVKQLGLTPPKTWADLTKPEWRGKFAIFNGSYEWYASMRRVLGPAAGDQLMRGLAANQPALVGSHQIAMTMTAAGEYAAGVNIYAYNAARLKRAGQPVELVNADPIIGETLCVAVMKNAPHPDAAKLFVRWLMSHDTQAWMAQTSVIGRVSGRKDVKSDDMIWNPKLHIVVTNPSESVNYAENVRSFNQTFGVAQ
ncbi:MAG TPA: extracellular solute-binding protein [Candidatus Acidoferrales bacterium]|nr:extracellular solute-binding protein [Candidatus Acidoferrales bacterium]